MMVSLPNHFRTADWAKIVKYPELVWKKVGTVFAGLV